MQKEVMKCVSHQQAKQLLHNRFIVVLGDSVQRSVYKDIVLLLQKDKYLTPSQLKSKGEMSFEQDCLVEGGCRSQMHNGTQFREVRQFQSDHYLVRFYFVTRIYSRYMRSILDDFRQGMKPDIVIVNSCVWDISRYYSDWTDDYKEDLHKFFEELSGTLPEDTLVIWNLAMPLAERLRGGFLVPEIEHKAPQLRSDVIEANFYSGTLAAAYGMDVLDLHFLFRFSLHHQNKDGVHWNAVAHRRITSLLLQHAAQAWAVSMPCPLTAVEHTEVTAQQPALRNATKPGGMREMEGTPTDHYPPASNYFSNTEQHPSKRNYTDCREKFFSDSPPHGYWNFETEAHHVPTFANNCGWATNDCHDRPPHHSEPYISHRRERVMRSRPTRRHYAPYCHRRHSQQQQHGHCY